MSLIPVMRMVTSRYPLNTPRASILRLLPAVPSHYGEFHGKHGNRFAGYWTGNDEVSRSIFWFGDFDPWVDRTLERLGQPGTTALDIGANIGATALTLARAVGSGGRVVCFEPMPQNISRLEANIATNGLTWVDIEQTALSDCAGTLSMILPKDHAGMSRVSADAAGGDSFQVGSIRFDDWLIVNPLTDISVCKIDVEGHEGQVLAGMTESLATGRIPAFVFERHVDPSVGDDPVFELFKANGYRLFRIEKGLHRVCYVPFGDPPRARPTQDFVAILPRSLHLLGLAA